MRTKCFSVIICMLVLAHVTSVMAGTCVQRTDCTESGTIWGDRYYSWCASGKSRECWYVDGPAIHGYLYKCTACQGSRVLTKHNPGACGSEVYYTSCDCPNNCTDVTNAAGNAGYTYSITCGSACDTSKQYKCASGYYGTANTAGTGGCTKCPANATCAGGNGSTFICNSGYYKNGSACTACPANATCESGSTKFTCNQSYYVDGNKCTHCPQVGMTGGPSSSVAITGCFIYDVGDSKRWYDDTGMFSVGGHCFYSTTQNAPEVKGWKYAS